jgi:hypothetical protein
MIDIHKINKRYASMPNDKLVQAANEEKKTLTKEALAVLVKEFETRNLDTTLFERTAAELNFDKERHWFFALEEKRKGKDIRALQLALPEHGLSNEEAERIINRLPDSTYIDEAFEKFITDKCENQYQLGIVAQVFLIGAAILSIGYGIANTFWPTSVIGVFMLLMALVVRKGRGYDGKHWYQRIVTNPESIVWIKPVVEKHTVWYVITLSKTNKVQLLTRDGIGVTFDCNDDKDRTVFFDGVKKYLPQAHIGYSLDIFEMYEQDPNEFINALQYENVYLPVIELKINS